MPKAFLSSVSLALASLTAADLAAAPRYRMKMGENEAEHGVNLVSIVQNPAIGRGFVALSALKTAPKRVHLSTEPAQQVLTGPALVPDEEILRLDEKGKPYFISFSAAEISQIKRRYALNGYQKLSNHEHSTPLDGIVFEESWIVRDSERDPAAVLGMDVPVGTWMLSGHIADSDFWANEVLTGNVTGFSIEGLFDTEEVTLAAVPASTTPMKKTLFQRLSAAGLALLGLSAVALKDGNKVDVAEDGTVSELDAEGNVTGPAKDGSYELEDGSTLEVKDGKKVEPVAAANEPASTDTAPDTAKVLKALEAVADETDPAKLADAVAAAIKDLGGTAPAPVDKTKMSAALKLAAVELFLEAVEMADGRTFQYNPITRRLLDDAGQMVQTGEFACADQSYFRVNTEQYTYQISKEDFDKGQVQASALADVELKLSKAEAELAKTPDGGRVLLSGQNTTNTAAPEAPTGWVAVALARAAELKAESAD